MPRDRIDTLGQVVCGYLDHALDGLKQDFAKEQRLENGSVKPSAGGLFSL
jgi:hypothetical protein